MNTSTGLLWRSFRGIEPCTNVHVHVDDVTMKMLILTVHIQQCTHPFCFTYIVNVLRHFIFSSLAKYWEATNSFVHDKLHRQWPVIPHQYYIHMYHKAPIIYLHPSKSLPCNFITITVLLQLLVTVVAVHTCTCSLCTCMYTMDLFYTHTKTSLLGVQNGHVRVYNMMYMSMTRFFNVHVHIHVCMSIYTCNTMTLCTCTKASV